MNELEDRTYHTERTVEGFKRAMRNKLYYARGTSPESASEHDIYDILARVVRDHLMDRWRRTVRTHYEENPRFVYYLSAEYLLGPQLRQNLLYTETTQLAVQALNEVGIDLGDLAALDPEPGLGNGGLGRLAACYLDSLATMDIPAVGYGIRYEFGIFSQSFDDGYQVESPDNWLFYGFPWEFGQPDDMVEVRLGGQAKAYIDAQGQERMRWVGGRTILGQPYHVLVPGYKTDTVNMLRLWRARASKEFDFRLFDEGDYAQAVAQKTASENITKVLYPNDNTPQGKQLRLEQQYFFVACSLRDIIRRFQFRNDAWERFPEKVVIQLNDTHPVIAIPELMRILVDEAQLEWETAWDITRRTFAYTCHTLLPEALEKWPVDLFEKLLPRHLQIIYELNHRFLQQVRARYPDDAGRPVRMSLIEEFPVRQVRMANLASLGSFSINGVAPLQSRLLREQTLPDFAGLWPEKFNNKTNGVTPRRFMVLANPRLSRLISDTIGAGWLTDLERLRDLEAHVDEADFRQEWRAIKQQNKADLAALILESAKMEVNPDSLYDVMVKRLHEYKRQLLKALHVITLYQQMKADPHRPVTPRTVIFGAKAAPGYQMAKLIIKLINSVAEVVNSDSDVDGRLKVAFIPNFNVRRAQRIYAAADLSEQISMAGKEASGTGNMKLALNGAVTIGTLDGANIQIREQVGAENFYLFGLTADEVFALKEDGYSPRAIYEENRALQQAIDSIRDGTFSRGDRALFKAIVDSLLQEDPYLLLADYQSYVECQARVAADYGDQDSWTRKSILNVARCGYFSSDRAIREYSEDIWKIRPVPLNSA